MVRAWIVLFIHLFVTGIRSCSSRSSRWPLNRRTIVIRMYYIGDDPLLCLLSLMFEFFSQFHGQIVDNTILLTLACCVFLSFDCLVQFTVLMCGAPLGWKNQQKWFLME